MMYVVDGMRVSLLIFQVSHGRDNVNQLTAALLVDTIGRGPAMAVSVEALVFIVSGCSCSVVGSTPATDRAVF